MTSRTSAVPRRQLSVQYRSGTGRRRDVPIGLVLLCVLMAAACGGTRQQARPTATVLTIEEISASSALTAFEAVQQLRPQFLRLRGARSIRSEANQPVIYVDNVRTGGIEVLRTIRAAEVEEIRYLSPAEATTRYGTGHFGGAIAVALRRS